MFYLLKKLFESGILVSGMSTVWEDTDGCAKKYMCALTIYLMTVLSSSYGIMMDRAVNAPCHGKNVVDGLNSMEKFIRRKKWNLLVSYQVRTYQILECFPVLQKTSPINMQSNVYTLSMINKY